MTQNCIRMFENLKKKKIKNLHIPKFDKSVDDRFPKKNGKRLTLSLI